MSIAENTDSAETTRILKVPALDLASRRNLQLPRQLWIRLRAFLAFVACIVLVAAMFIPADLITANWVWLLGATMVGLGLFWIKTGMGSIRTGMGIVSLGLGIGVIVSGAYFSLFDFGIVFWLLAAALAGLGIRDTLRSLCTMNEMGQLAEAAARRGCRIFFFRPFDDRFATFARNSVLPIVNGYGEVTHASDKTFESVEEYTSWAHSYTARPLMQLIADEARDAEAKQSEANTVAEFRGVAGEKLADQEWRSDVEALLQKSDLAVVDVSSITENVGWELRRALRVLPSERVILVAHVGVLANLEQHANAVRGAYVEVGAYDPRDSAVILYNADLSSPQYQFGILLHERMKHVVDVSISRYAVRLDDAILRRDSGAAKDAAAYLGEAEQVRENYERAMEYYELAIRHTEGTGNRESLVELLTCAINAAGKARSRRWREFFDWRESLRNADGA